MSLTSWHLESLMASLVCDLSCHLSWKLVALGNPGIRIMKTFARVNLCILFLHSLFKSRLENCVKMFFYQCLIWQICPILTSSKRDLLSIILIHWNQVLTSVGPETYLLRYWLILLHKSGIFDGSWSETLTNKGLEAQWHELECDFYDFKIIDQMIKCHKSLNYKVSHVTHRFF